MKLLGLKREPVTAIIILAMITLVAGALGMWAFQHRAELQELHERLSRDANELVHQTEVFRGEPGIDRAPFSEKYIPLDLRKRLLEIRSDDGNILYYSSRLGELPAGGQYNEFYQDVDGRRHRLEVFHSGGFVLSINADLDPDDNFLHEVGGGLLLAVPAMFVIILIGGLWLRDRTLRPVQSIREGVSRITARSLNRPLSLPSGSEQVSNLVSTLNVTFKELHSSFEQAARFSADASHQLKTPLTVLRLGIEDLLTDPRTPVQQRSRIDELLRQIHRLTSIVEKLLLLSRADAGRLDLQPERCDAKQLFSSFIDDISSLARENGLAFEADVTARGSVLADRCSVAMILENLMENAVKYNRPGGRIKLVISEGADWTELVISNTGELIPPERVPYIFERFFRGHGGEETSGYGLGLSIARELAEANHGRLELIASTTEWTEFRLRLPAASPQFRMKQSPFLAGK